MTIKNEKKISWWFLSLISSYRLILKCIKRIPVAEYKHGVFSGDKTSTKTRYWPLPGIEKNNNALIVP